MQYLQRRKNAFYDAFRGLVQSLRRESHMRIHLAAAILAVISAVLLKVSVAEWLAVVLVIALVFMAELMNTAIEKTCDMITLDKDERVRYIKDISAAFVLLACLAALAVGCMVYGRRLWLNLVS